MMPETMTTAAMPATIANAVTMHNGRPTTTSIKIAQVFGKRHREVIRTIRALDVPSEWGTRNFAHTPTVHPQNGQVYDVCYVTRDGFTLLAMGFTGKRAMQFKLAYIEAFNAMERVLQGNGGTIEKQIAELTATVQGLKEQINLLTGTQPPRELPAPDEVKEPTPAPDYKAWHFIPVELLRRLIRARDARYRVAKMPKTKAVEVLLKMGYTPETATTAAAAFNK